MLNCLFQQWQDIEIFWHGLRSWFGLNECDKADDRYIGEVRLKVKYPVRVPSPFATHEMKACVCNHQENSEHALQVVGCSRGGVTT